MFSSAKIREALPGHMARVELYPLSVTGKRVGNLNLMDFLLAEKKISMPGNIPPLSREQTAQTLIDGWYNEIREKGSLVR